MKGRTAGRLALCLVMAAALGGFFLLGLDRELSLASLKGRQSDLLRMLDDDPAALMLGFVLIYTAAASVSIPGAVLTLSLAAGAVFGLVTGTALCAVSLALGSLIAFLGARYVAADWVQARLGPRMDAIHRGLERDGAWYLLALRLMPVVPYFLVNLGMATTRMRARLFAPVTLIGVLPATAIYVNAGTQLAKIARPSDILSPGLLVSLALLGLFPLLMSRLLKRRARPLLEAPSDRR